MKFEMQSHVKSRGFHVIIRNKKHDPSHDCEKIIQTPLSCEYLRPVAT